MVIALHGAAARKKGPSPGRQENPKPASSLIIGGVSQRSVRHGHSPCRRRPAAVPAVLSASSMSRSCSPSWIGILLGHFYPDIGAAMKLPLGDAFIKLV